ncbi:hypothetical protein I3760_02G025500 [Carya illinoinensis]|nr:hypothetical protein I3760_02G025500 [Carya illinoinensis]
MKKHAKKKAKMKKMFTTTSQRVSFTTDTWTFIQNISYTCITSHYIDSEWNLRKQIIRFKEIIDHMRASIGALMDYFDNASANDTAIEWFKRNMSVKADVIRNHEFIHVQCCAHIFNLIVICNIVRYVRASPQRLPKFKAIASQLVISYSKTLCLDVSTQWNTTHLMLDVAQKYQRSFERMEVEDGGLKYALLEPAGKGLGAPDTHDWTSMRHFMRFLQGDVEKINRLLFVAIIFDLRYKLALIEFWTNFTMGVVKAAQFITTLKMDLDDLYSHYNNSGQSSSIAGTSHSIPTPLVDDRSSDDSLHPPRRGYNNVNQYHQLVATRNIMQCTSKIEWYFIKEVEAPSDYQILSRIARNVLAIPITTVASESAFSTGVSPMTDNSELEDVFIFVLEDTEVGVRRIPIGVPNSKLRSESK